MISQELWFKEASREKELSLILRDLEKLEGFQGQVDYVYQEPKIKERIGDLERFLDRHGISPDKLPWWPKMLLRYHQNRNLKKTVRELYQRVYETPFWKAYLAGETWDSVFSDTQKLLQYLLAVYRDWPNHLESTWDMAKSLFERWDREVDSKTLEDSKRKYGREPNEREMEPFVNRSFPSPEELIPMP